MNKGQGPGQQKNINMKRWFNHRRVLARIQKVSHHHHLSYQLHMAWHEVVIMLCRHGMHNASQSVSMNLDS